MKIGVQLMILVYAVLITSCLTAPSPNVKARVYQPLQLPTAIDKAKTEIQAGRWIPALVILANNQEDSPAKTELQNQILDNLQAEMGKSSDNPLKAADLGRTLALFGRGKGTDPLYTWPQPVGTAATASREQWLQGTAMVIVNRGLKLENGMGSPDIMLGSGFFISADGYLLTNHHVIESVVDPEYKGVAKLSIKLPNSKGERLPAKVVGWDKNHDLALLKVEYKPDFVFKFSSSAEDLRPGKKLSALGSPGGLEATVTEGIVSAVKRPLLPMGDVIQIDVAVNPGNSGGPLVNEKGEVVGIVFAGISGFQGVNFAIPGETVKKLLPLLKDSGKLSVPWMGLGLVEDLRGLEVTYVLPEGPGDWAGLKVGDRLTTFNGQPVKEVAQIQEALLLWGTSGAVKLEGERDGKAFQKICGLVPRPEEPIRKAAESDLYGNIIPLVFGMVVEGFGTPVDRQFRVVKVFSGSYADEMGLTPNDPLTVEDAVIDREHKVLLMRITLKKRLGGYLESAMQLVFQLTGRQMV